MTLLQLAIILLQSALDEANVKGAAPEIIANLSAALASLMAVHGQDVTFEGLEKLRVKPTW